VGLTVVTPAGSLPVSRAEAKRHLGIADGETEFDTLVDELLAAAIATVEEYTGRLLGSQTWKLVLDDFSDAIELPRGPVSSVSWVKYFDTAGVEQTLAPSVYTVDLVSEPQWVVLNSDESWPDLLDAVNVVSVQFVAGDMPPALALAVKMLVAQWFQHRGASNVGNITSELPFHFRMLVDAYRTTWAVA